MRRGGFSLLETLLTLGILLVGLGVTFALFERGARAFSLGGSQNDLAGDARRSLLALVPDIRLADADLLSVDDSRTCADEAGRTVHRDAFCMGTLSHWDRPDNFNLVQAGIYWDTYSVVYANRAPRGQLVRQNYRPPGAPYAATWDVFPSGCLAEDFRLNAQVTSTRVLSKAVEQFEVLYDENLRMLQMELQLVDRGAKKVGGRGRDQRSHASVRMKLENTAPD